MDFIQHDTLATQTVEKTLGVKHHATNAREFAVEILNFREILTKAGFSYSPHASEPDDGSLLPRAAEQLQPETPVYHMQLYLHIVAPNVNAFIRGCNAVFVARRSRRQNLYPRAWYNYAMEVIVKNRDILGGTPVFRGTRVPIQTLFDYLEGGETLEDFLEGFPTVSRELTVAALEEAKRLLLARP